MLHELLSRLPSNARAIHVCGCTGKSEKARSDKVDIVANGNGKPLPGSEDKLAPSTPETAPQGVASMSQLGYFVKMQQGSALKACS